MPAMSLPDGRTLEFGDVGDGEPVLFFHGRWAPLLVPDATPGIRLICVARPGYLGSAPRPGRRVADWADDVAALADSLGLDRFSVVGFSDGGAHALACAALIGPPRVRAVVHAGGRAEGAEFKPWDEADEDDDPMQREGARGDWEAIFERPWGFDSASIRVPTLLCRGELDHVPATHVEALATAIPDAIAVECPGLEHLAVFERWPEVVEFVRRSA
jgi:pimeloyl-ACP methyl ester carboxylesterase